MKIKHKDQLNDDQKAREDGADRFLLTNRIEFPTAASRQARRAKKGAQFRAAKCLPKGICLKIRHK